MNREVSVAENAARLTPNQFQRIGIFLLRHQARAASDSIAQRHPFEFFARIENPVFRKPAEVQHDHARGIKEVEREIAVRRKHPCCCG